MSNKLAHSGIKGMRWGIRKNILDYKIKRGLAAKSRLREHGYD